ncbi:MAG: glycosyltransferase family 4 protein [Anaerolineae bacterium]|nr:glycosyltransferase family 4 protein [Gloeobacterales cyanobacterium ES-bin-313]
MRENITIVTQFYPPDFAATGQFIQELAVALANEGHNVQVFTGKPSYAFNQADAPREEFAEGVHIVRTRAAKVTPTRIRGKVINSLFYFVRSIVKLRKQLWRSSHLIFTSAPPFLGLTGWFYNKMFNQSYSCIIYDVYPEVAVRLGVIDGKALIVRLWEAINRKIWKRAKTLIVMNEEMKQLILSKDPSNADKIHVVHSWADPKFIKPMAKSRNWFALRYQLDETFTVLYSGNLGRVHDSDTILECVRLLNHDQRVRFVFIGGGAGLEPIKAATRAKEISNCLILPYQDKETLPYSLTACDLALVSLKQQVDGVVAPSKLYSLLAAGKPIASICHPNSYLRNMLREGDCGECFDNGNAAGLAGFISSLMAKPETAEALGQNARRYFDAYFTLGKAIPLYLEALGIPSQARSSALITAEYK